MFMGAIFIGDIFVCGMFICALANTEARSKKAPMTNRHTGSSIDFARTRDRQPNLGRRSHHAEERSGSKNKRRGVQPRRTPDHCCQGDSSLNRDVRCASKTRLHPLATRLQSIARRRSTHAQFPDTVTTSGRDHRRMRAACMLSLDLAGGAKGRRRRNGTRHHDHQDRSLPNTPHKGIIGGQPTSMRN